MLAPGVGGLAASVAAAAAAETAAAETAATAAATPAEAVATAVATTAPKRRQRAARLAQPRLRDERPDPNWNLVLHSGRACPGNRKPGGQPGNPSRQMLQELKPWKAQKYFHWRRLGHERSGQRSRTPMKSAVRTVRSASDGCDA